MLIPLSEVQDSATDEGLRGWHACDETGGTDLWYRLSYDPAYSRKVLRTVESTAEGELANELKVVVVGARVRARGLPPPPSLL